MTATNSCNAAHGHLSPQSVHNTCTRVGESILVVLCTFSMKSGDTSFHVHYAKALASQSAAQVVGDISKVRHQDGLPCEVVVTAGLAHNCIVKTLAHTLPPPQYSLPELPGGEMGGESGDGALPEPAAMPEGGPDAGNCPQQDMAVAGILRQGELAGATLFNKHRVQQERQYLLPPHES